MTRLIRLCLIALLLFAPAASMAAPCWMKPAEPPCHQSAVNKAEQCKHLTVADCAGPQMSSPSDAPQPAKAQLAGVEYVVLPQAQTQGRVQPLLEVMTHGPPATAPALLSILLTTQRYLI